MHYPVRARASGAWSQRGSIPDHPGDNSDPPPGVLTPAEEKLAADPGGHHLVKEVRTRLIEGSRPMIDEMMERLTRIQDISLQSDVSLRRGERVTVISLAENLEGKLRR